MAKSFLNQQGLPIGLRNNNPGNLRPGIDWLGATGTNGGFLVFQNIAYGLRAMALDIGNDIRVKHLDTIRKLISEYAPVSENDTAAYIARVSSATGFSADQTLPRTQSMLQLLIRGMLKVELGSDHSLITDSDILEGLQLLPLNVREYFGIGGQSNGFTASFSGLFPLLILAGFVAYKLKIFKKNT